MVIDTNNSIKNGGATSPGSRGASATAADKATAGKRVDQAGTGDKSDDSVVLSQEAKSLNRLQGAISELPDVDSERVANIQQAIAEGRFSINAERIAENMLRQDDLLG